MLPFTSIGIEEISVKPLPDKFIIEFKTVIANDTGTRLGKTFINFCEALQLT